MRLRYRWMALLGAIGTGSAVAAAGFWSTGSQWWFLAVPGCVAGAWLFVADPTRCTPERPPAPRRPR